MRKYSAPFLLALLALSLPLSAPAQGTVSKIQQSFGSGVEKVELLADRAEYDWSSDWATFHGNVVIRCNGNELRGETVRFNAKTHAAEASSKVVLMGANGEFWSGESISVDMTNPKFPTIQSSGMTAYYAPYRVEAEKGGVKDGAYVAESVYFTTCTNAPGLRHYEFWARDITVVPDDDLTAHGAVPYLFGIPFFYWPYFWKDLHNHYGFRFEPGYRSRWGAYLLTTYKFRIWRYDDENWGDSRTSFDMRSKRGFGYGEKINWYDTDVGTGWFSIYGVQDDYDTDKLLKDGIEDTERYRLRLNHDLAITGSDRLLIQGLFVSDKTFQRDFFEEEHDDMPQPENYVQYIHTSDYYSLGLGADFRINDFYTQVERLPEFWFNVNQTEIGTSSFFYESENSVSFLRKVFDEDTYEDANAMGYDATRLDTLQTFSYPFKVAGFLSVVPSVSWRGTYYSKTRETFEESIVTMTSYTNAIGQVFTYPTTNVVESAREGSADFRNVVEFDLDLSFKTFGSWVSDDGTPWRNIIEPYTRYTYIPEPNIIPDNLFQFDSIDEIDFTHTVRLGVRNRWQCKDARVGPGGQMVRDRVREFAEVDAYGIFRIEPQEEEKNLQSLHLDTTFRPTDWLRSKADIMYDADLSELSRITSLLELQNDQVRTTGEYVYRVDANSLIMGEIAWKATDVVELAVFGRYDFEEALAEKVGAYYQMNFDCISMRLVASVYPGYTRTDGYREEDDYRFSFVLWENHFAPDNINDTHY